MSLTKDQITPGATYSVRYTYGQLSRKRFSDAVADLKKVNRLQGCSATYDSSSKSWTVTLGDTEDTKIHGLSRLATALFYHAEIERIS